MTTSVLASLFRLQLINCSILLKITVFRQPILWNLSVKKSINDDIEIRKNWMWSSWELAAYKQIISKKFKNIEQIISCKNLEQPIQSLDVKWSQMSIIQAASTSSGLVSFGKLTLAWDIQDCLWSSVITLNSGLQNHVMGMCHVWGIMAIGFLLRF